jgi:hypothetical protein
MGKQLFGTIETRLGKAHDAAALAGVREHLFSAQVVAFASWHAARENFTSAAVSLFSCIGFPKLIDFGLSFCTRG